MPNGYSAETWSGGPLVLIATSTVLASIVTLGVNWIRDVAKIGRDASFAGLYVSITFEAYANECATMVAASENYEASDGEVGRAWRNLPAFPEWHQEVDWKALGIQATTRSLDLIGDIEADRASLNDLWDFDDEEAIRLAREKAVEVALSSLAWASDLRRSRSLPKRKEQRWDVKSYLLEKSANYEDRRVAQERARVLLDEQLPM